MERQLRRMPARTRAVREGYIPAKRERGQNDGPTAASLTRTLAFRRFTPCVPRLFFSIGLRAGCRMEALFRIRRKWTH